MDDEQSTQDIVEDTDADTGDIEEQQQGEYFALSQRIASMEEAINRMSGVVSAMQKAQKNLVDMGAVIREDKPEENVEDEGFVPLEKLDFTI